MAESIVYDKDGNPLGSLPTAKSSYTLKNVPLHTAKIVLPANDLEGNALCKAHNRIELFDNGSRVELFRIIKMPTSSIKAVGGTCTYNLEHVLAYLFDNIMPGHHEIGGTGYSMRQCFDYILSFQTIKRWKLGICEFDTYFQYTFDKERLLRALLALPKQLAENYCWTCDTTTTPWTLNLLRPSTVIECEMRYKRNMQEIAKGFDAEDHCTRVWPYGYGEGINQLTIADANNGIGYLDADTIDEYGIIEAPFADTTFENAEALKNRAQQWLNEHKRPRYSYTIKANDIYPITKEPFDKFYPGKLCRINDEEHGEMVEARVTQITKPNPETKPEDITVTIANAAANVANELADLATRARINELYANGSSNVFQANKFGNISTTKPIKIKLYFPKELVNINELFLVYELDNFRADVLGAAAGGGSNRTSAAGGGGTTTSASGGGGTITTQSKSGTASLIASGPIDSDGNNDNYTGYASGADSHRHYYSHRHPISGTIIIPALNGTVPTHSHNVTYSSHNHEFTTPEHTHAPLYGIFEGPTVQKVTIKVDGTTIAATHTAGELFKVTPYLGKDSSGKILRETIHEIDIYPVATPSNPEGLAYADAFVFEFSFIRSQGGGLY